MSLKVWLPLIGNLKNIGTLDVDITSIESSPIYTEGKLGSCYERATTSTQSSKGIKINTNFLDIFGTEASVAIWVKPLGTHTHYNGTLLSSGNWNAKRWAFGVSQDNTKVDVLCGGYNTYITCSVPENEWTHLASTYNNGVSKLYKNGEYIGELTGRPAFDSDATWTGIGRETYANGYFGFNGLINDVRIYDHCLSAAEVKEISQGLVLHYKLDSIKVQSGTNLVTGVTAGGRTTKLTDGRIGVQTTGENSDTYFSVNLSENIVKDTQYYLSCEASGISEGAFWGFPLGTQGNSSLLFKIYNGHNEYIFTANDVNWGTNRLFFDDTNRSDWANKATFWDFQLIKLSDEETQLQILDSSGYKYHGTVVGLLTFNNSPALYSKASYMNNTSSSSHIEINDIITLSDEITVSFWVKASKSKPQVIFVDPENSIEFGILNNLGYINIVSSQGWTLNNFKDNDWNHIVVIRKNSVYSLFVNSILATRSGANNYYLHQATKTWLLNRSYNNSYAADASISDFRIYATALSQEDIQALYNVRARIDNLQNIHSYEFNETQSNLFRSELIKPFAKAGTIEGTGEITNRNDEPSIVIRPAPFYKNLEDNKSGFLQGYFTPNTSYVFDIWEDTDDVIYQGNNMGGGFQIIYTDGTSDSTFVVTGGNKGFQHKQLITPATKSIERLSAYYHSNINVYYKLNSYICPVNALKIMKNGLFVTSNLVEDGNAALHESGIAHSNEFIEI